MRLRTVVIGATGVFGAGPAGRLAEDRLQACRTMPCLGRLDLVELEAGFAGYALRTGVASIG